MSLVSLPDIPGQYCVGYYYLMIYIHNCIITDSSIRVKFIFPSSLKLTNSSSNARSFYDISIEFDE